MCVHIFGPQQRANLSSCPCGYQFCMLCGEEWKSCDCPIYGGHRRQQREPAMNQQLQAPAVPAIQDPFIQHRAIAAALPRPAPHGVPGPAALAVRRPAQGAANQDCAHPKPWSRYQHGYHRCEICHKSKKDIQVGWCRHCNLVACYQCRRNRLR